MNSFNSNNETSGYFEKIRRTAMFYDSPHDSRKSITAGKNALCILAEIGQCHVSNFHNKKMNEAKGLSALEKEQVSKLHHESDEEKEARSGKKGGD